MVVENEPQLQLKDLLDQHCLSIIFDPKKKKCEPTKIATTTTTTTNNKYQT
jgi:hypothetical protein